jgi:hypothetical protein
MTIKEIKQTILQRLHASYLAKGYGLASALRLADLAVDGAPPGAVAAILVNMSMSVTNPNAQYANVLTTQVQDRATQTPVDVFYLGVPGVEIAEMQVP